MAVECFIGNLVEKDMRHGFKMHASSPLPPLSPFVSAGAAVEMPPINDLAKQVPPPHAV